MRLGILDDGKIAEQMVSADQMVEVVDGELLPRAWRWELETAGATPTAMVPVNNVALDANTVYAFEGFVVARYGAASTGGAYKIVGAVKKGAANANTALIGSVGITALEDTAGMDLGVTADTTNGRLTLTATGVAATQILWRAELRFLAVGTVL